MSNQGDYGQYPNGTPQWGAPQQGFDPNQTQNHGQGFGQQQPQQQWGGQQNFGQPQQPAAPKKPLPWTLREMIIGGVGLLILLFSFFPLVSAGPYSFWVWNSPSSWVFSVLLPVGAAALVALRPFIPNFKRVGSLSIDQFASVAFSVAAGVWTTNLMSGASDMGWPGWLMFILSLGGVFLTVVAPFVPGLKEEFDQRPDESSPRAARTTRVVPEGKAVSVAFGTPAAQQNTWGQQSPQNDWQNQTAAQPGWGAQSQQAPAADNGWQNQTSAQPSWGAQSQQAPAADNNWGAQSQQAPAADNTWGAQSQQAPAADANAWATPAEPAAEPEVAFEEAKEDASAEAAAEAEGMTAADSGVAVDAQVPAEAQQPFWALAPDERAVVDEQGNEIFRVGPTAWALVVEDRGTSYVIRHEDGRTGTLNDVSGVIRN